MMAREARARTAPTILLCPHDGALAAGEQARRDERKQNGTESAAHEYEDAVTRSCGRPWFGHGSYLVEKRNNSLGHRVSIDTRVNDPLERAVPRGEWRGHEEDPGSRYFVTGAHRVR